jgi:hypothetical protein
MTSTVYETLHYITLYQNHYCVLLWVIYVHGRLQLYPGVRRLLFQDILPKCRTLAYPYHIARRES